ncbi:Mllt4p [Sarracenia purpurea var. burkii]
MHDRGVLLVVALMMMKYVPHRSCCWCQRRPRKMNPEMAMVMKRNEEREALRSVIQQWNANRLDLFELSEPNEEVRVRGASARFVS